MEHRETPQALTLDAPLHPSASTTRDTLALWSARAYLVLSFYVLGCLVLENDVNYATWHLVSPDAFGAFHRALEARLGPAMFLPMTVHLLLNVLLLRVRPASLPRGLVGAALALHAYVILESLAIQVPIHRLLNEGSSPELLERLNATHRLYRLPAELSAAVVDVLLLGRMTRPSATR